ncbi:DNA fragmentation factor subunit beta [Denticeps clupeoides]|uniref:DNA fragmentation factor subunit beta n=1 Tax=Denticeps clupeoides TaxID=299321 RepID=A0AAY4BC33_9TELE|nr:DNA fragmentation factor subunit beta [Denticeps clupeoides]
MTRKRPTNIKLVKVRRPGDAGKFGVAAGSLEELVEKACRLLKSPQPGSHVCLYEDGTELTEDYFQSLADNTELVLLAKGESWTGFFSDIKHILFLDKYDELLIQAAKDLLSDEHSQKRRRILGDLLFNLKDKSETEKREDDEGWFEGVDARFKTKSAYMKYNCESRIRGYLKEVDAYAQTIHSAKAQAEYKKVATSMTMHLKSAKYNGCYFDRTEEEARRVCTKEGWFSCQGAFDEDKCRSLHSINPYGNRESRILFSTWNLDHRIEKKRTILPALTEALDTRLSSAINIEYFYKLLFTTENLKLVHIVCHKKGSHSLTCDKKKIYKRMKRVQK